MDHRHDGSFDAAFIPTLHKLSGFESVGILFYDGTDSMRCVKNKVDHESAYNAYGCNATCFQTACGIYTAMNLIGIVPGNASYCFTDIARAYTDEVLACLDKLKLSFEQLEGYAQRRELEAVILPLFNVTDASEIFKTNTQQEVL